MPQYSNTQPPTKTGLVVNAVLNTETNQITYTVTAPNGATATNTQDAATIGNTTTNLTALFDQLTAAGVTGLSPVGIPTALGSAAIDVKNQDKKAQAAATATNTPVPDAPAPPPSTNNAADPEVAPAPNNTPPVQNAAPATTTSPANLAQNAATTNEAAQDKKLPEEPNLAQNAATTNEAVQDKKLPEEPNLAQNAATTNETIQDKKLPVEPNLAQNAATTNQAIQDRILPSTQSGLSVAKLATAGSATTQDSTNFQAKADWRVRLSLSPGAQAAKYLYWANPPGILAPLQATDGVIFPYTPSISVAYNANYDPTELTHSNYKFFTYRGSAVDSITIGCEFTAQDVFEAQYLLAVIHFFRSVTKMFYGQDQNPKNGTPPPLCYLSGLGAFQFDAHPLAITNFTYSLPTDVDYIKAGSTATPAGVNRQNNPSQPKPSDSGQGQAGASRMGSSGLNTGAVSAPPDWQTSNTASKDATYVPTKISITIQAVPIVTRNDISNKFSLKEYATGALLRGTQRAGGGIW